MRVGCAWILFCALLGSTPALHALAASHTERIQSEGRSVAYDIFDSGPDAPILILLHGASGPEAPLYWQQAKFFQSSGHTVLLLHYFDATRSRTPTDENYRGWVAALDTLVHAYARDAQGRTRTIVLVGYSLGASIALAAGSQGTEVAGIAEWYGSLPDSFFAALTTMPPLLILHGRLDTNIPVLNALQLIRLCQLHDFDCRNHLYPDQGHGFSGAALVDADRRTLQFIADRTHAGKVSAAAAP